jgi:hypothetical protein
MLGDAAELLRILHTTYIFSLPVNSAATAVLPRLLFVCAGSIAVGGSCVLNPTGKGYITDSRENLDLFPKMPFSKLLRIVFHDMRFQLSVVCGRLRSQIWLLSHLMYYKIRN